MQNLSQPNFIPLGECLCLSVMLREGTQWMGTSGLRRAAGTSPAGPCAVPGIAAGRRWAQAQPQGLQ